MLLITSAAFTFWDYRCSIHHNIIGGAKVRLLLVKCAYPSMTFPRSARGPVICGFSQRVPSLRWPGSSPDGQFYIYWTCPVLIGHFAPSG